jgi:alpha-1,3-mannosyltransferase
MNLRGRPLRVLHVTPIFYPSVGGIENVVANLSSELRREGIDSDIAVVGTNPGAGASEGEWGRVTRLRLYGHRLAGYAPGLARAFDGYDLLHVHDPQFAALSVNVALAAGRTPKVVSTHGGFRHTDRLGPLKSLFEATALPPMLGTYNAVLASSASDAAYFRKFRPDVRLVENGVDTRSFAAVRRAGTRSSRRWIYWGRLAENKGLGAVIDWVGVLKRQGLDIDLLIAGADVDDQAPVLRRQIAARQLSGNVTLAPALGKSELLCELAGRGVFVTGSTHEGFGLSIIEAMAAGLPVVCRDLAPMNGFVQNGENGFLVDFKRPPSQLLSEFLSSGRGFLAMSDAARRHAEPYGWSVRVHDFRQAYEEVLAR